MANAPGQDRERTLRHPWERSVFIVFVTLNLAIMAGAVCLAASGPRWLGSHPVIKKNVERIRTLAILAALSPPALVVFRHVRCAYVRGNAIRLSSEQIPSLYSILLSQCTRLGIAPIPELYVSDAAKYGAANAFTSWHLSYIVLGSDYLQLKLEDLKDVYAFHLGRQLGRLRLGHASWINELLLSYVLRIPYLKNPLLHVQALSEDRYGAYLAPQGARGLVIIAAGRRSVPRVNILEVWKQAQAYGGFWAFAASLSKELPNVMQRIKDLTDAGLLDLEATPGKTPIVVADSRSGVNG